MKTQHRTDTVKALMLSVALATSLVGGGCAPAGYDRGAGEGPATELDAPAGTSTEALERGTSSGDGRPVGDVAHRGGCRGAHCAHASSDESSPPPPGCKCPLCASREAAAGTEDRKGPSAGAPSTLGGRGAEPFGGGEASGQGSLDGGKDEAAPAASAGGCTGPNCDDPANGVRHADGCKCSVCQGWTDL